MIIANIFVPRVVCLWEEVWRAKANRDTATGFRIIKYPWSEVFFVSWPVSAVSSKINPTQLIPGVSCLQNTESGFPHFKKVKSLENKVVINLPLRAKKLNPSHYKGWDHTVIIIKIDIIPHNFSRRILTIFSPKTQLSSPFRKINCYLDWLCS